MPLLKKARKEKMELSGEQQNDETDSMEISSIASDPMEDFTLK